MNSFKKIHCANILLAIALIIFIFSTGTPVRASDQVPEIAQSFSQYFNPKVLRAVDAIMKKRSCTPDGYWRIWTYGFHKSYKGPDGNKFEAVLNWDGFYYNKGDFEPIGDWTSLK